VVRSTAASAGAVRRAEARTRGGPIVEMATVPVPNYAALSQIAAATAKEQATLVRRQATHEIAIAQVRSSFLLFASSFLLSLIYFHLVHRAAAACDRAAVDRERRPGAPRPQRRPRVD
jgi:hypothetical protein